MDAMGYVDGRNNSGVAAGELPCLPWAIPSVLWPVTTPVISSFCTVDEPPRFRGAQRVLVCVKLCITRSLSCQKWRSIRGIFVPPPPPQGSHLCIAEPSGKKYINIFRVVSTFYTFWFPRVVHHNTSDKFQVSDEIIHTRFCCTPYTPPHPLYSFNSYRPKSGFFYSPHPPTFHWLCIHMMSAPSAGLCGRWPWGASGSSVDPLLDGYGTNFDEMQQDANQTFTAAVQRIWQRPAAHGSVAKDLPRLARRVTIRTRTGRCVRNVSCFPTYHWLPAL